MPKSKLNKSILLSPGPVLMPPSVLKSLAWPEEHHRSQNFEESLSFCRKELKKIFHTQDDVIILNSSGTGAMEASITNTLSPKDEVLCIVTGKFGERWLEMCKSFKLKTHILKKEEGSTFKIAEVKKFFKTSNKIKAVFCQACETSSGTLHPIKELGKFLKVQKETLFIVDAITAVLYTDLKKDKDNIDVLIAGSQKSFLLPTGLSFISLSKKAWSFYKKSECPKFYFDLKKENEAQKKGRTQFSSNVPYIRSLRLALEFIKKQKKDYFIKQAKKYSQITIQLAKILKLSTFSKSPSPSLTALKLPNKVLASKIQKELLKTHKVFIAIGQGSLKEKILRIGHMGYLKKLDFLLALSSLIKVLHQLYPSHFGKVQYHKASNFIKKLRSSVQL